MFNQIKTHYTTYQLTSHLWAFLIGMSCGMPFILTSSTLKAWLSEADMPIYVISFMNLLNLTYLIKFSWAPIVDNYHPKGFGRYKSWIIYTHFLLGICLICLSYCDPNNHFFIFTLAALFTAFMGANVTLSLDGYWIRFIDKNNVQAFAGITEVGYRLGKIITGGIALIIADFFDWHVLYQLSGLFFFLLTGFLVFLPSINEYKDSDIVEKEYSYTKLISRCWKSIYNYGGPLLIVFLLTVKVNEALEHSLLPVFMLRELSLSLASVGIITKVIGIIANMIGLMIAVKCIKLWNYKKTLIHAIQLHILSTTLLSLVSIIKINQIEEIIFICLLDNIARGLISTTLLSFYAEKIAEQKSATQFSMYALVTGCSGILFAPIGGLIVYNLNWTALFIFSVVATIPSYFAICNLNHNLARD